MSKLKDLAKALGSGAARALAKPQELLLQGGAKALGAMPEAEGSEAASQAIVEKIAQRLGLPDSTLTNAAKALGVAGLEVFADPLGPLGKIAKGAKIVKAADNVVDIARKEQALKNLAQGLNKASTVAPETAFKNLAEKAKTASPEAAKELTEAMKMQLKRQKDVAPYKPGLQDRVGQVKRPEDTALNKIGSDIPGQDVINYKNPSMKVDKPQGEALDYGKLRKEFAEKNKKR